MATRPTPTKTEHAQSDPDSENWQLPVGARTYPILSPDPEPDPISTPADRVAAMLGELAGDERAVVKLYREMTGGKYEWCDDYAPAEFEAGGLRMIRSKWGAGNYEVRLYGNYPDRPGFGIRARERLTIAHSTDSAPPTHGVAPELARVLDTLAQGQAAMLRALTERPPAPDPMQQMGAMLGMMAQMREAFGIGENRERTPVSEIVAAMREMKAAASEFGNENSEADPMMQALPTVLELVREGMKHNGRPAPVPVRATVHRPASPPLPVQPLRVPPSIATVARPPAPAPVPASVAEPVPTTHPDAVPGQVVYQMPDFQSEQSTESEKSTESESLPDTIQPGNGVNMLDFLREQFSRVGNTDPEVIDEVAESVYANMPDELLPLIGQPNWQAGFSKLLEQLAPDLAATMRANVAWFDRLGARVVEIVAEESGDDSASEREGHVR